MSKPETNLEEQVDPAAVATFRGLTNQMADMLLREARLKCPQGLLKEQDLVKAYQRLDFPSEEVRKLRDAQSIISLALRENRVVEWVSYSMAIILFAFGLILLSAGVLNKDTGTRTGCLVAGSIVELLILIPFRFAINSRRHNISLRVLGMLLALAVDPKKLASIVEKTILWVVAEQPPFISKGKK
jgi:hypothetical protein